MRLVFTLVLTASLVAGVIVAYGSNVFYFIDPPAFLIVVGGTGLFMVGCFPPRDLGIWIALGSGLRRATMPSETRRAVQMCAACAVALMAMVGIDVFAGAVTLLQNLTNPSAIGPALAIMLLSPLYAIPLALPLTAMWTQITCPAP